ncbi:MAG: PilZ domain-containing protein [Myxococcota bacterium]|nr:PilZ domain-containing protein [Myxococcota bacterium]
MTEKHGPFRRHRRHHAALQVRLGAPGGEIVRAAQNVSLGGLRVSGPISGVEGEKVELAIRLPHMPKELRVTCEVVWVERCSGSDEATVGVRFLDLDPADRVVLGHVFRDGLPE